MAPKKTAKASGAKKSAPDAAAKKSSSRKTSSVKGAAKKFVSGKTSTSNSPAKQPPGKKSKGRKYSPAVSEQVGRELHEMHRGRLRSGGSGEKVTNPKQAIAIALSEARRAGKKVPPNPNA